MSIYQSLFEVRGKIGATTFRKRKGSLLVGKTSSLDKAKIQTAEEFGRTRENMSEFKGTAFVGKALRHGLGPVMRRFKDGNVTSRMTGIFRLMLKAGTGIRGQRPIEILPNKAHLVGAELIEDTPFTQVFSPTCNMSANPDRNQVTLVINPFVISGSIRIPQGATHWKLVLAIASVSDHVYDTVTSKYVAVDESLNSLGDIIESALIPVQGAVSTPLQLVATLPNSPILPTSVALVACVGIEFSQDVSGLPYVFAQHNAMRIAKVF
jgi:hypothetical protein